MAMVGTVGCSRVGTVVVVGNMVVVEVEIGCSVGGVGVVVGNNATGWPD
jgi:hypothetical protein